MLMMMSIISGDDANVDDVDDVNGFDDDDDDVNVDDVINQSITLFECQNYQLVTSGLLIGDTGDDVIDGGNDDDDINVDDVSDDVDGGNDDDVNVDDVDGGNDDDDDDVNVDDVSDMTLVMMMMMMMMMLFGVLNNIDIHDDDNVGNKNGDNGTDAAANKCLSKPLKKLQIKAFVLFRSRRVSQRFSTSVR